MSKTRARTDASRPDDTTLASEYGDQLKILRKSDGGTVYLLGTCHVSEESASNAARLVKAVRPSAVVLELCSMRIGMLTPHSTPVASSSSDKSLAVVAGGVGSVLSDWTSLIRMSYQLLEDSLEVPQAGSEFRAAADEAKTLGAEVVLGDRSMEVTRLRLKRLIPLYELIMAMVVEDSEWTERQGLARHAAAVELQRTSNELAKAVGAPHTKDREATLKTLSASLSKQAKAANDAAIPGFADAVLSGLLNRFWCKELIGEADKQRLREALDGFSRIDPLTERSLPPTMRRILIDERDMVLCDKLRSQKGDCIVGVVGKGHLAGIEKVWEDDFRPEQLAEACEVPRPPILPLVSGLTAIVGVPYAAYRSRAVRYTCAAGVLVGGGGALWLAAALRERVRFFTESQKELRERMENEHFR